MQQLHIKVPFQSTELLYLEVYIKKSNKLDMLHHGPNQSMNATNNPGQSPPTSLSHEHKLLTICHTTCPLKLFTMSYSLLFLLKCDSYH